MNKKNKILHDDYKDRHWFFRNYFWTATIAIVLICVLLYAFGGSDWNPVEYNYFTHGWGDGLYFNPLLYGFLNSFGHVNWQHTLLNMLCFAVVGTYLERKIGTIKLFLLVIALAFLSTGIIAANSYGVGSIGYSGVNYALYFYIITDYIFMLLCKDKRSLPNVVSGAIVLALIYLAMCFNGGSSSFGFEYYPWDLMHNQGHTGGAFAGLIAGIIVVVSKFKAK